MKLLVIDAFTERIFGGNTAGVVLLDERKGFPSEDYMRLLAAELRYSETAFVRMLSPGRFHIRYFTPTGEIDLCGHATVAAFAALRECGHITDGTMELETLAGKLHVDVSADGVMMDMAAPEWVRTFAPEECEPLYQAFGCTARDMLAGLAPAVVSTGLRDIILPVSSKETLDKLVMDRDAVMRLSAAHDVVGFHVCHIPGEGGVLAYCRNFAPLCGIDEESATGTSNGALTYYLYRNGRLTGDRFRIVQGEAMQRPSEILTQTVPDKGGVRIRVGGRAVTVFRAEL